jgi:hypothetical protein
MSKKIDLIDNCSGHTFRLSGSFPLTIKSFNLFYDQSTGGLILMLELWSAMGGRFGATLKLTDASAGDPGIAAAQGFVLDFLQKTQEEIFGKAVSIAQSAEVEHNRQDLVDAIAVGLNTRLASVDELLRLVSSRTELPSATEMADRIIRRGSSRDLMAGDLAKAADKFSELVRTIGSENDFLPGAGVIDERMRELAHFRRVRSGM